MKKIEKLKQVSSNPLRAEDQLMDKINELIDVVNEMSEGCEHDYEKLVCKKCGDVDLDCPCGCGMSMDDEEYEKHHRANYISEDKQEDEEEVDVVHVQVIDEGRDRVEAHKIMPKSEARRLGLID